MLQSSTRRGLLWALCGLCVLLPVVIQMMVFVRGAAARNAQNDLASATTQPSPQAAATTVPSTQPLAAAAKHPQASTLKTKSPRHSTTDPFIGHGLGQALAWDVHSAVVGYSFQATPIQGGAFAQIPFQDLSGNGVLVGFRVGLGKFLGNDIIQFLQPIYLTPAGERLGEGYGTETITIQETIAPVGYAVGAVDIHGGGGLDSMTLTYMRIEGESLDPSDAYITARIGGSGGGEAYLGGDGTPIIGISGRYSGDGKYLGIGLIFLQDTPTAKPH